MCYLQGDYGAPLFCFASNSVSLAGIALDIRNEGTILQDNSTIVFTKVSYYKEWIMNTLSDHGETDNFYFRNSPSGSSCIIIEWILIVIQILLMIFA